MKSERENTSGIKKEVDALKMDYGVVSTDVKTLQIKVDSYERQMRMLTDTVLRQNQELDECKKEIEALQSVNLKPNLVITGLVRIEHEKCKEVVLNFCKEVLKTDSPPNIVKAYRLGNGKKAPMFVRLMDAAEKAKFFAKVSNLKGKVNAFNNSYSIDEQLPPRMEQRKRRNRKIMAENNRKTVNKLIMSFEKGKLKIGDKEYALEVRPPTLESALRPKAEDLTARLSIELSPGKIVQREKSTFQGYITDVNSIKDVNNAYAKLKSLNMSARHIMCAFRIPHENSLIHQDYADDDEHAGGKILLDALTKSEIYNKAVFVVRKYDGQHIGPQRFEAILEVAKSAFTLNPLNKITGENQFFWTGDSKVKRSRKIRGSQPTEGATGTDEVHH